MILSSKKGTPRALWYHCQAGVHGQLIPTSCRHGFPVAEALTKATRPPLLHAASPPIVLLTMRGSPVATGILENLTVLGAV